MRITNRKVQEAIAKLKSRNSSNYELRTVNTRPDKGKYRYILYRITNEYGFMLPGTYGSWVAGFKKLKDFYNYVNEV